ncbi:MAG: hypothetical protein R2795_00815 [Saprospiraceae bacterium]
MVIDRIVCNGQTLRYTREYHAVFVHFENVQREGDTLTLRTYYYRAASSSSQRALGRWLCVAKDLKGRPWTAVACEGTGASLWEY